MSEQDFGEGDLVDIHIKGAKVVAWQPAIYELTIESTADANSDQTTCNLCSAQVTVERIAPAEWPPRPGDLWRDQRGNVWFAADLHDTEETASLAIYMLAALEDHQVVPDVCNEKYGPLTFVHREEQS